MEKLEYRCEYNKKDSAIAFLLSLFAPFLVSIIYSVVCATFFPEFTFVMEAGEFVLDATGNRILTSVCCYVSVILTQLTFFLSFFIYNKLTKTNTFKANNIKFNLNIYQCLIIVVIGIVLMYGFSPLTNYIQYVLSLIGFKNASFNFLDFSNVGMLIFNIIVVGFLPAVFEELMFRGIVFNGLKKDGIKKAIVFTGLMFAIMHLSIHQTVYQFVLGMLLCYLVYETGSIVSSMLLHFFNNAFILVLSFFQTSEEVAWAPSNIFDHILPFVYAIGSLAIVFALIILLKKVSKKENKLSFNEKSQQDENINNNGEIDSDEIKALQSKEKNKAFDNMFLFIASLAVGIVFWLVEVILDFMG